jgi:hypothetical protein
VVALIGLGCASAVLYAAWVLWVPLLPINLYVPLLDLGKITGYRWTSALLFLCLVLALFALYGAAYWRTTRTRSPVWLIVGATVIFCIELSLAYPATAADVFGYMAHGRVLAYHHANPFVVAPNTFPSDPIVPYIAFGDEPSQYGPLWVILDGGVALAGGGSVLTEMLLYKAIGALAHLAGGLLVYRIAARLSPLRATTGPASCALLYLWNPLLLWEMVGNAHNDALMMLFGLAAVLLFLERADLLVLPALALGALVKLPVAIVAPVLWIGLWRRNRAQAIEGTLLAVVLAGVVYRPFWEGLSTLTALRRTDLFTASLGSVMRLSLWPLVGLSEASAIARSTSLALFVFIAVTAVLFAVQARTDSDTVRLAYVTLLAAVLLATTWFQAWYVVWALALGAAQPDPRRHLEVALLSLGGLLQYFVFIYLWVIGVFPPGENLGVQAAAYLAIIGPLLIAVASRSVLGARYRTRATLVRG